MPNSLAKPTHAKRSTQHATPPPDTLYLFKKNHPNGGHMNFFSVFRLNSVGLTGLPPGFCHLVCYQLNCDQKWQNIFV
jgi:hypothetical protein